MQKEISEGMVLRCKTDVASITKYYVCLPTYVDLGQDARTRHQSSVLRMQK